MAAALLLAAAPVSAREKAAATSEEDASRTSPSSHPVISKLEEIFAECLAGLDRCPDELAWSDPAPELLESAANLGSDEAARLLWRLEVRGVFSFGGTLTDLLTKRMTARLGKCAPPTADEVLAERAALEDFAVVESTGQQLTTRAPTDAEKNDLAYFLASVSRSGPKVGEHAEQPFDRDSRPANATPSPERADALAEYRKALSAGDAKAIVSHGTRYLASLGFPAPMRIAEDHHGFHGPRSTFVMRDMATAFELLGDYRSAEALYRRASEDTALSGTGRDARWKEQVAGTIRAGELAGDCRLIVAERLISIDPLAGDYGPRRLAMVGFDLQRLYAGALLTANRTGPLEELQAALVKSPVAGASERLSRRGREAWEARVFAAEGFADEARREALPVLTQLARKSAGKLRRRIVWALGESGERPIHDPCKPRKDSGGRGRGSSEFVRKIRPLSSTCRTHLKERERSALSKELERFLSDPDIHIREEAVTALGRIAAKGVEPLLRKISESDPEISGEVCSGFDPKAGPTGCVPNHPLRRAASAALEDLPPSTGK